MRPTQSQINRKIVGVTLGEGACLTVCYGKGLHEILTTKSDRPYDVRANVEKTTDRTGCSIYVLPSE